MSSHAPDHPDNAPLVDFARRELGLGVLFDDHSRDFGRPSVVWRLTRGDGSHAWLKQHESTRHYERELTGLEQFVPALGEATWWSAPTVLAKDDEIRTLLLTEVDGAMADSAELTASEESAIFELAGRFACGLHGAALPAPEVAPGRGDLRARLEHYLAMGAGAVDETTLESARSWIDRACSGEEPRLVPCHMDYSPRNWILRRAEDGLSIGIIDWERGRWDHWLQDVQRMEYDHWHHRPDLREAFFRGYGRDLTSPEETQLQAICLVTAISSIRWAADHDDAGFVHTSRAVIERILGRPEPAPGS